MSTLKNRTNNVRQSWLRLAKVFFGINCIIVSVLTLMLTGLAIINSHYDRWFPLAVVLTVVLFITGRWVLQSNRHR
jgi:hypothetical protein